MNTLVLYFSRTGNTRLVARRIADELGAELEELTDRANRHGILGYLRSGRDVAFGRRAKLNPIGNKLRDFDLVVIGTPVWRLSLCTPIRTFLEDHAHELPRVAFFCTMGGVGSGRVFRQMERLSRKGAVTTLAVTERDLKRDDVSRIVASFVDRLRPAGEPRPAPREPAPTHAHA
jgi:flavodoxin